MACSCQGRSGSETLLHRSGGGCQKGVARRPARREPCPQGLPMVRLWMTLGKAQVIGIRGKPSTPWELPYAARQSGPDVLLRRVCRPFAAAPRMAGSDRSNRGAVLNAAPPGPVRLGGPPALDPHGSDVPDAACPPAAPTAAAPTAAAPWSRPPPPPSWPRCSSTAGAVTPAWAHGAPTDPVSRVSACSPDGGSQRVGGVPGRCRGERRALHRLGQPAGRGRERPGPRRSIPDGQAVQRRARPPTRGSTSPAPTGRRPACPRARR